MSDAGKARDLHGRAAAEVGVRGMISFAPIALAQPACGLCDLSATGFNLTRVDPIGTAICVREDAAEFLTCAEMTVQDSLAECACKFERSGVLELWDGKTEKGERRGTGTLLALRDGWFGSLFASVEMKEACTCTATVSWVWGPFDVRLGASGVTGAVSLWPPAWVSCDGQKHSLSIWQVHNGAMSWLQSYASSLIVAYNLAEWRLRGTAAQHILDYSAAGLGAFIGFRAAAGLATLVLIKAADGAPCFGWADEVMFWPLLPLLPWLAAWLALCGWLGHRHLHGWWQLKMAAGQVPARVHDSPSELRREAETELQREEESPSSRRQRSFSELPSTPGRRFTPEIRMLKQRLFEQQLEGIKEDSVRTLAVEETAVTESRMKDAKKTVTLPQERELKMENKPADLQPGLVGRAKSSPAGLQVSREAS